MTEAYRAGLEAAAAVCDAYTEVNFEAAGDSVLLDPVLRGKGLSPENLAESERQQIAGLVHSSQAHAGKHLAAAIRALPLPPASEDDAATAAASMQIPSRPLRHSASTTHERPHPNRQPRGRRQRRMKGI